MKTEKLKLETPKTSKLFGGTKSQWGFPTEHSNNTDPTTTCTTVGTTTHLNKV